MKKYLLTSVCVIVALFLLIGCGALMSLIEQPLQTYTFNYNGKDYPVMLPKDVPKPLETAVQNPRCFFGYPVCIMMVQYKPGKVYPTLNLWFTKELGVFLFTYFESKQQHTHYIYVKGIPVLVDCDKAQEVLDKLKESLDKLKGSVDLYLGAT